MRAAASGVNMHCYSDLTLQGQGRHGAEQVGGGRLGVKWRVKVNAASGWQIKRSWLINRQRGKGEDRETKPKECRPFTYSHSKTESQLHPPARSVLSRARLPFDGESSNVLQYGKGQESRGEALGSPPAEER